MPDTLDISSFESALSSFERAVVRAKGAPEDEELRDAVIQRFEYTYELAWKMMKREIIRTSPSKLEIEQITFKDRFRLAAQKGLIDAPEPWFDFREKRNMTSHVYDSGKAREVYGSAEPFLEKAKLLFGELKRRNA